jgi:hypothetical protein
MVLEHVKMYVVCLSHKSEVNEVMSIQSQIPKRITEFFSPDP